MACAPLYYEILGDGMDNAFPPGSILECVDFGALGREPDHGDYVLVEHISGGGEATLSCFQHLLTSNGPVLITHPKEMETQRVIESDEIGEGAGYKIVACVMAYHCAE